MISIALRFPEGKRRAMTFSYDDGVPADLRLIDLMKKYGVKGTFNLNTYHYEGGAEPDNRLTFAQIKEIANDSQFEIACHGHRHPYYTFLPQSAITDDIITNRIELEKMTDKIIRGFAYPYGPYNETSEQALKAADVVYARTTNATKGFSLPQNWLQWHPTCHHLNAPDILNDFLEDSNISPNINSGVMYVWGHSYEFDNSNNWDLIEDIFGRASEVEDIWFATNMEIYEYAEAFKQLIFSANGNTIYNATRFDLWALCNGNWQPGSGKIVKIPAGETVVIK